MRFWCTYVHILKSRVLIPLGFFLINYMLTFSKFNLFNQDMKTHSLNITRSDIYKLVLFYMNHLSTELNLNILHPIKQIADNFQFNSRTIQVPRSISSHAQLKRDTNDTWNANGDHSFFMLFIPCSAFKRDTNSFGCRRAGIFIYYINACQ